MGVHPDHDASVDAPQTVVASRGAANAHVSPKDVKDLGQEASTWRSRRKAFKEAFCQVVCSPRGWKHWVMCVLFWLAVIAVLVAIFAVLLPKALAKPIGDLMSLLMRKLTRGQLIAVIMAAVALCPCTLVLPMLPFVWIAGLAFPFGKAFGIVMAASVIGMTIQYWAARKVLKTKVEKHLLKRRKDGISVALRAVDIAGPWKVVALVRLGPSPYAAMNYIFGVCPTIRFHQYIIASTICISHHRALSVFLGRSLPTLAQLFSGQPVTDVRAAVYRFVVLALGIALLILIVILAKKALKKIEEQELEREREEAAAAVAAEAERAAEEGIAPADGRQSVDHKAHERSSMEVTKAHVSPAVGKVGGGAVPGTCDAGLAASSSSSTADLQVVVVDPAVARAQQDAAGGVFNGTLQAAPAAGPIPPAAADAAAQDSTTSRWSSMSSMRALLTGNYQRSS